MNRWTEIPEDKIIEQTIEALKERNINAEVVNTGKEARDRVFELLPQGARVLTSTSITLEKIGVHDEIEITDKIVSVRKQYMKLDHDKDADKIRELRANPDVTVGSVQAVTQDGQVLIASNTGSQLAPYSYGAPKVIWVVGAQKIVKDYEEGMKRIYEYIVPLEEKHMQDLYGRGTNVSKLLIVNKEVARDRINVIFVKEVLGF